MTYASRPDHAGEVRAALTDPFALCDGLGLISGRRSYQRQARGVTILCPFHDEHTPSCSVFVKNGTIAVRCHGCSASGDALTLIAVAHRLDVQKDFRRVLELGADLAGIRLDDAHTPSVQRLPPRPAPPEPERLDDATFDRIGLILSLTCPIRRQPDVCDYLARRGLLEEARDVLWALPGVPEGQRWVRDAIVQEVGWEAWKLSGLAKQDGSWTFPEHRLCIPWRDHDGHVINLQRRLVTDVIPDGQDKYVFTKGRRIDRYPFGVEGVKSMGPAAAVAFVEGSLDALALRSLCTRHDYDWLVLGLPGTHWKQCWAKYAEARVAIVALDADKAGEAKVQSIASDLYNVGVTRVRRERPVHGKDWAEVVNG